METCVPRALVAELLGRGLEVRLRVTGASMLPLLRGGEVVTVAPAEPGSLAPGDLLLCRGVGGELVLHRLERIAGAGADRRWVTRGDALNAADAPFAAGEILGKVARVEGVRPLPARVSFRTDSRLWRLASRGGLAAAGAGRLARRLAGYLARRACGPRPGGPPRPARP